MIKNLNDIKDLKEFKNLELLARHVVEGFITGLHKSPFHGFSVEFAEHRIYNAGESTKHIDWKLYARTEKLFTKRYEEETNLRSHIVIDTSSSMYFPVIQDNVETKLAFSIYCSAALIYMLRKQRDAVGLVNFAEEIELFTDTKVSSLHSKMLFNELEKLLSSSTNVQKSQKPEERKRTYASKLLHQIAENIHKRSLVIIFSDLYDSENFSDLFSALQHLRYNKHEVILFHVTDKQKENEFKYQNRPYKFVDLETGEVVKLNPNQIRSEYIEKFNYFYNQIKTKCAQYKIDFVEADINNNFNDVLYAYMIKRTKLY